MPSFGPYESSREISSSSGAEVFSARNSAGGDSVDYAVKIYSLDALVGDNSESRSDLDPVLLELSRASASRIEIQQKAAQSSPFVAPVFESGRDSRGAWYVTLLYPRTLQKIVLGHVGLSVEGFHRVFRCVIDGALSLKQTSGRSHGNLKLSNVLISGAGKIKSADVVISDPLPGGAEEGERYELEDLHGIGRLIYQLVFLREITNADDWALLLPLSVSKEWTAVFGKNASRWVDLCNRLLDPNLSLESCDLERLAAELGSLEPKPPISTRGMAMLVGLVCVCGVAVFLYGRISSRSALVISVDPPGATILLDGISQKTGRVPVLAGQHTIVAQFPELDDVTTNFTVAKGQTTSLSLALEYVATAVSSVPPGAAVLGEITVNNKEYKTNLSDSSPTFFRPKAQVNLTFTLSGYQLLETNIILSQQNAKAIAVVGHLTPIPTNPNEVHLTFTGLLRGAKLAIVTDSAAAPETVKEEQSVSGNIWEVSLPVGRYRMTVSFANLNTVDYPFEVKPEAPETNDVRLQWAKIKFPADVGDVRIGDLWEEKNPTTLIWPPGPATLTFEKEGYITTNITVDLTFRQGTNVDPKLRPMVGSAYITSDPDGAQVFDSTNGVRSAPVKIDLQPGSYTWRAQSEGLDDVTTNFFVEMGKTTNVRFNFSYGTLNLVVSPTNITVKKNGVVVVPPYNITQKSGQRCVYWFTCPDYDSTNLAVTLEPNEARIVPVTLPKSVVSANFVTDPAGGQVFDENGRPIPDSGFRVRWGLLKNLTARYGGLETITTNMWISIDDANNTNLVLPFRYGTLAFTSSPPGARIYKDDRQLGTTPTNLYLPPSDRSAYRLEYGRQTTNLWAAVNQGATKYLGAQFTNSDVLEVPLPGTSEYIEMVKFRDYWVGKSDVTQGQYQQIAGTNPSYFNQTQLKTDWDPSLPVENLVRADARKFCSLLTEQNAAWLSNNDLKGFVFTLPNVEEWLDFLGDGKDRKLTYYNTNRTGHVGLMGANSNGLNDVNGNVRQWLLNGDLAGASYNSKIAWAGIGHIPGGNEATKEKEDGFRIILKAVR
jgi:hypothetical protein